MNPSSAERSNPEPAGGNGGEQLPTYGLPEERANPTNPAETIPSPESSSAGSSSPAFSFPFDDVVQATASPAVTPVSTASNVVTDTAEDTDLIEKEWVLRAKQVLSQHQADPYEQTKQLNVVKAEYMKKRYNKTVKLI